MEVKNKSFFNGKAVYYYTGFILATFVIHVFLLIFHKGDQLGLYFAKLDDFFADFINPVRFAAGRNPYFEVLVEGDAPYRCYPALSYIVNWMAARIAKIKGPVNGLSLYELWNNNLLMLFAFFYLMFMLACLVHSVFCLSQKFKTKKIITAALMLSYPVFFTIERANCVILSAACICWFVAFYDNPSKRLRIFACLSLAIAATLKIYPVIFGLLYFEKKQYKEILISALIACFLFFTPFLFFKHGLNNIPKLIHNVSLISGYQPGYIKIICVLSLCLSLFQKDFFNRLACITFPFLVYQAWPGFYLTLYFFPLVVLLFNQNEEKRFKINFFNSIFFSLYFTFVLSPLQVTKFIFPNYANSNYILFFMTLRYVFIIVFVACLLDRFAIEHIKEFFFKGKSGR